LLHCLRIPKLGYWQATEDKVQRVSLYKRDFLTYQRRGETDTVSATVTVTVESCLARARFVLAFMLALVYIVAGDWRDGILQCKYMNRMRSNASDFGIAEIPE